MISYDFYFGDFRSLDVTITTLCLGGKNQLTGCLSHRGPNRENAESRGCEHRAFQSVVQPSFSGL